MAGLTRAQWGRLADWVIIGVAVAGIFVPAGVYGGYAFATPNLSLGLHVLLIARGAAYAAGISWAWRNSAGALVGLGTAFVLVRLWYKQIPWIFTPPIAFCLYSYALWRVWRAPVHTVPPHAELLLESTGVWRVCARVLGCGGAAPRLAVVAGPARILCPLGFMRVAACLPLNLASIVAVCEPAPTVRFTPDGMTAAEAADLATTARFVVRDHASALALLRREGAPPFDAHDPRALARVLGVAVYAALLEHAIHGPRYTLADLVGAKTWATLVRIAAAVTHDLQHDAALAAHARVEAGTVAVWVHTYAKTIRDRIFADVLDAKAAAAATNTGTVAGAGAVAAEAVPQVHEVPPPQGHRVGVQGTPAPRRRRSLPGGV